MPHSSPTRRAADLEVRKLAVPSLLEARVRLSRDEKLAKLLLLRKRGIHHDPIDRACRRLFRLRFGRGAFSRLQLSAHGIARCLELSAFRSEEHTSELQSLMRISYAVFCLKKKTKQNRTIPQIATTNTKHKKH